jgi:hypothetical protein
MHPQRSRIATRRALLTLISPTLAPPRRSQAGVRPPRTPPGGAHAAAPASRDWRRALLLRSPLADLGVDNVSRSSWNSLGTPIHSTFLGPGVVGSGAADVGSGCGLSECACGASAGTRSSRRRTTRPRERPTGVAVSSQSALPAMVHVNGSDTRRRPSRWTYTVARVLPDAPRAHVGDVPGEHVGV